MTTAQTAKYLNVSERTLRRWVKHNKFPYGRVGKTLLFNIEDVRHFVEYGF